MTTRPPAMVSVPLPESLTDPLEKLVYLYVRQAGGASVHQLRDALGVPQLRLYPAIGRLAERDLIVRHGDVVRLPDRAGEATDARA